jgi:hypothetical protein
MARNSVNPGPSRVARRLLSSAHHPQEQSE